MVNPNFITSQQPSPDDKKTLMQVADSIKSNDSIKTLFDVIPDIALIVNRHRQIIFANENFLNLFEDQTLEDLTGIKLGDSIGCNRALSVKHGCGTSGGCRLCGGFNAVTDCFSQEGVVERECRMSTTNHGILVALDFMVRATRINIEGKDYACVILRDIYSEKQRRTYEHLFIDFLIDQVGSIKGFLELAMETDNLPELKVLVQDIFEISDSVVTKITRHEMLLRAERKELQPSYNSFRIVDLIDYLCYNNSIYFKRRITHGLLEDVEVNSDINILRNTLSSLIENAVEASSEDSSVMLSVSMQHNECWISVHNNGWMNDDVKEQVFQRSFTTKGTKGRGLGCYGAKLLVETILQGKIEFDSDSERGTTFTIRIPLTPPEPNIDIYSIR